MTELRPCTECNRHVRADHDVCPFCAANIAPHVRRVMPSGRLTRAAVFASALAGAGAGAAGCGPGPEPAAPTDDQHINPTPDAMVPAPPIIADAGVSFDETKPAADAASGSLVYPDHDHPNPKPYGAPPARTRLV